MFFSSAIIYLLSSLLRTNTAGQNFTIWMSQILTTVQCSHQEKQRAANFYLAMNILARRKKKSKENGVKKKTINAKACLQVCSPRLSFISPTLQHTQSPVNTCKGAAKHDSCPHGKSSLTAFSSETQLCSAILQIVRRFRGEAPLQDCLCNGTVIRLEIYQAVIGSGWGREEGEEVQTDGAKRDEWTEERPSQAQVHGGEETERDPPRRKAGGWRREARRG